ncbi:MAG: tripartite tricarboxylate transporter substrate binding protein [Aminivibrio sp.]
MRKFCLAIFTVLFVMASLVGVGSASDNYPDSPIKIIVPLAPGGGADMLARMLAPHLGREMGTSFFVENISGAGTQVGLTALLAAPSDGYTIAATNQPHLGFTIAVQKADYKETDFAWVNIQLIDPLSFVVRPEKPWKDLQDLINDIKANPGEIAIGVTQTGPGAVFLLFLQHEYGLDFVTVPYSGGGEARTALLGDHIDVFLGAAQSDYSIKDQVRSIGIGWSERSSLWPDTPTFEEATGDKKLGDMANVLVNFRGILVSRKFKDEHPERFAKLLEGYKKAYYSEEHMADAERTGQTAIMHWLGPDESDKLSSKANEIVARYAEYFRK